MKVVKIITYLFCLVVFGGSCTDKEPKLPADFEVFYERFHNDSAFQMEHIIFPLEGMPGGMNEENPVDETFRWYPEIWELHRPMLDENDEFIQQITILDSYTIVEIIRYKKTRFGMERRFAKMGDDWFLIYYVGMNLMTEESDRDILGDKVDQLQTDENGDPIFEIKED